LYEFSAWCRAHLSGVTAVLLASTPPIDRATL
jgi:hypothetical protein